MPIARKLLAAFALLCLIASPGLAQGPDSASMAQVATGSTQVSWNPGLDAAAYELTVVGPAGETFEQSFAGDGGFTFDLRQIEAPSDGSWTWEIRRVPRISDEVAQLLADARAAGDDGIVHRLRAQGALPTGPFTQAGSFRVDGGTIVQTSDAVESPADGGASAPAPGGIENITAAAQVFTTDLIVQGSACVGMDCVTGENFGFDTFRLKENNLRIHFDDTSNSGSFPRNDWRIIANDSSNGGASYLAIEDSTAGRIPFRVEAGARANALVVDSQDRIGMGTDAPVVLMHSQDGNTPTLRLHQDGSDGFQTQIWDIAGNETNFFIRDVTHGSKLPFRIKPGAPENSIFIAANGDIGIGTNNPTHDFHLVGNDGGTQFYVAEQSTTEENRIVAIFENNGPVGFQLNDTSTGADDWSFNNLAGGMVITRNGSGLNEFFLSNDGDLEIHGVLNSEVAMPSSRTLKTDFQALDARTVLERVAGLEIPEWRYLKDETSERHIGPIAEQWHSTFGLSEQNDRIGLGDMSGVALLSVQGLYDMVQEKEATIDRLEQENASLAERLEALEAAVEALAQR